MVGKTPPATRVQQHRFEVIKEHSGCICCLLMGHKDSHASIEHVTDRGRRMGNGNEQHNWTIGLCAWHHFGHVAPGWSRERHVEATGPSLAHGRKRFEGFFGEEEKLVQVQDFIVQTFDETPWAPYNLPEHVASDAQRMWIKLNNGR